MGLKENFNKYTFKVAKEANKIEIKNAIEEIFKVKVLSVNTINVLPKRARVGQHVGFKPAYKKAIVKLADGNKIDAFEI
jgi:large subunit ribosomal protein L23